MSSPAALSPPSTSTNNNNKFPQEQITFRFCRECSNMLYPKEDRMTSKLMFACRTCQFSEEAQSSCVFRNNMYNTVGETAGVTQDVGSDPTVGSSGFCDFEVVGGEGEGEGQEEGWCCTYCGREIVGNEDGDYEMEIEEKEDVKAVSGGMISLEEMSRLEDENMEMDEEVEQGLGDDRDNDAGGDPELKTSLP